MSIYTVYRVGIWMPILVPAVLLLFASALGLRLPAGPLVGEVLMYSLIYGGVPYAALAAWATIWVEGRSETEIRRLMFRAPLLMIALFGAAALTIGVALGHPGPFVALAILGGAVILPLGYAYVGLAVVLRHVLVKGGSSD